MPYLGVTPAAEFTSKDLNGKELILDADADTTITADTDDQIDIKIAGADDFSFKANTFEVQTGSNIDMNGTELILDANGNTSITADTDDQIDIKIAGADDFQFTANTMSVLSGSTLNIDSGATIANSGTATGFTQFANWSQSSGHLTPDNATYGIHLGVSSATAANLLDDYEEGTFTATLYFGENDNGEGASCTYTKIGNSVRIAVQMLADSSITGTGNVQIRGLPFTNSGVGVPCAYTLNDRIFLATLKMYVTGAIISFVDTPSSTSDTSTGATEAMFGTGAGKWVTVSAVYVA